MYINDKSTKIKGLIYTWITSQATHSEPQNTTQINETNTMLYSLFVLTSC